MAADEKASGIAAILAEDARWLGGGVRFRFNPDSGRHTNLTMVQVTSISCKIDSTLLVYLVKPLL